MIIVGELLNSSRKAVREAIEHKDAETIGQLARDQGDAGANYIDVNAGVFEDREPELLRWLVQTVQEAVDLPCCLDSPNPAAIEAGLAVHRGIPLLNSVSLERERFDRLMPLIRDSPMRVIALCMSDDGMPETADQRLAVADRLISALLHASVELCDIFVDPLVQPVATGNVYGRAFLEAIGRIMTGYPGIHTLCGLSNISYGLPGRKLLNRTFADMAVAHGMDGAIINPLDRGMMAALVTAETLLGRDRYCKHYIKAYRAGNLDS